MLKFMTHERRVLTTFWSPDHFPGRGGGLELQEFGQKMASGGLELQVFGREAPENGV